MTKKLTKDSAALCKYCDEVIVWDGNSWAHVWQSTHVPQPVQSTIVYALEKVPPSKDHLKLQAHNAMVEDVYAKWSRFFGCDT